ncbi:hypothetical protein N9099_00305, partial [Mariniblastus sp.]|nr:hypothetical protein [Mariniblastus sp.]
REHLSSGFLSTQTDGLKVAFSVPLEIDGNVMGVVALTINLGDIAEFDLKETDVESAAVTNGDIESHYMMLVDTRGSNETEQDVQEALILEHPAMEQVWQNSDGKELDIGLAKVSLPKSRDPLLFNSLRYGDAAIRAEVPFAGSQGEFQFKAIIERIPLGELLVGTRKSELPDTVEGIEVWAVLNYENELTVVDQLASKLAKLGAMAGLGGFVFVIGMLLFVKRLLAESRKKLTWSFEPDRTEYNATVSYKAKIDD